MTSPKAEDYGAELFAALRARRAVEPLIARDPGLTLDDAYAVSLDFLARRVAEGERVVGKKIGVTSKAVQDMLGVRQPDFGFLTDWMHIEGDIDVDAKALIAPRAEAEIAFQAAQGVVGRRLALLAAAADAAEADDRADIGAALAEAGDLLRDVEVGSLDTDGRSNSHHWI